MMIDDEYDVVCSVHRCVCARQRKVWSCLAVLVEVKKIRVERGGLVVQLEDGYHFGVKEQPAP